MRAEFAACFVAAALFHALLLFGFRLETGARPLEMSDEPSPVDVSLVEAAPAPPAAPPAPPEPAPAPGQSEPQPAPDTPTPPASTPAPASTPQDETMPAPGPPPPRVRPKPAPRHAGQKRSTPHTAAGTAAALAGAASRGAAIGPLSSQARYVSNPRPEYPPEARQMRQQGVVMVNVEVGTDGHAGDVSVSRTSGYPLLDNAAARAVRRWIFEPARAGSLPVPSQVEVPVRFSLSE